jgi:hypothetical protein
MSSISSFAKRDASAEKAWFKEELSKIAHMDAPRNEKVEQLKKKTKQVLSDLIAIYESKGYTAVNAKQKAIQLLNKNFLPLTIELSKTRRAAASLRKKPTLQEALGKRFIKSLFEGKQTKAVEPKSIKAKRSVYFAPQIGVRYFEKDKSPASVKHGEKAFEPMQTILLDKLESSMKKACKKEHQKDVVALFEKAANKGSFQDAYRFLAKNLPHFVDKKVAAQILSESNEEICRTILKEISWKLRQVIPDVENFYVELFDCMESINKSEPVEVVVEKFLNAVHKLAQTHPFQEITLKACTVILESFAKKWDLKLGKVKDLLLKKGRQEFFENLQKMLKKGLPDAQHPLINKTFAEAPSTDNPLELLTFIIINVERTPPTRERTILIQKMKNDFVSFFLNEVITRLKKTEGKHSFPLSNELQRAIDTVQGRGPKLLATKPKALNPQEAFQEFINLADHIIVNRIPQEKQLQAHSILREYL